jgi:SAM-dependent methyltransferase
MIKTNCIICGKKEKIKELFPATFGSSDINQKTYSARRVPDRVHYRMVKCDNCGLVFSSPILPPDKITGLYKKSECTYTDQVIYIANTYLKLFSEIKNYLPQKPKVLEIGCGDGFFLKALFDLGIKSVFGVEPGKDMVKNAAVEIRKNIKSDIFKKRQFPAKTFDLVCCFHTLDHLTDPALFVKEAYAILKPGGIVLVVTHDTEGLSVSLFGERSPIFDIEHIYLFSKPTISKLFEMYGFNTLTSKNLVNSYPLSYWLRMSGLTKDLKNFGQKILSTTGLANVNFSLAGGNLVYIGQKPKNLNL